MAARWCEEVRDDGARRDTRRLQKVCALQRGLKTSVHAPPGAQRRSPAGTMDLVGMPRLGGLKSERFRLDAVSETDVVLPRCDIEER